MLSIRSLRRLRTQMTQTKKTRRINPIFAVLVLGLVAFILYIVFFINPAQVIAILSKTNLAYFGRVCGLFAVYDLLFTSLAAAPRLFICKNQQTKSPALHVGWIVF